MGKNDLLMVGGALAALWAYSKMKEGNLLANLPQSVTNAIGESPTLQNLITTIEAPSYTPEQQLANITTTTMNAALIGANYTPTMEGWLSPAGAIVGQTSQAYEYLQSWTTPVNEALSTITNTTGISPVGIIDTILSPMTGITTAVNTVLTQTFSQILGAPADTGMVVAQPANAKLDYYQSINAIPPITAAVDAYGQSHPGATNAELWAIYYQDPVAAWQLTNYTGYM